MPRILHSWMGWRHWRILEPLLEQGACRTCRPWSIEAEGRPAFDGADTRERGVAVVPDGSRPGRSRGLRHPRDRAGDPEAVPRHLQVDQGADVRRGPLGGRQGWGAPTCRCCSRRRTSTGRSPPAVCCRRAYLHAAGRPARAAREGRRAVGDQRHVLDHLPQLASSTWTRRSRSPASGSARPSG